MLIDYIKSPKTGRWITVRGQAYADLMGTKYETKAKKARRVKKPEPGTKTSHQRGRVTKAKDVRLRRAQPNALETSLASVPKSRKARRRVLKSQIARQGEGRGGRTRGWAAAAPQRGRERHELMRDCGSSCFLKPETEGFPICAALREGHGCKVDCRGITSAKVRAGQWKYPDVYDEATKLQKKYKCRESSSKKKTTRRRRGKRTRTRRTMM